MTSVFDSGVRLATNRRCNISISPPSRVWNVTLNTRHALARSESHWFPRACIYCLGRCLSYSGVDLQVIMLPSGPMCTLHTSLLFPWARRGWCVFTRGGIISRRYFSGKVLVDIFIRSGRRSASVRRCLSLVPCGSQLCDQQSKTSRLDFRTRVPQ